MAFTFTFDFDASGSPDAITLPQDFPSGLREIVLAPPVGHSWTYFGPNNSTGKLMGMDQTVTLKRSWNEAGFRAFEVIGAASLDTGSGTGTGQA